MRRKPTVLLTSKGRRKLPMASGRFPKAHCKYALRALALPEEERRFHCKMPSRFPWPASKKVALYCVWRRRSLKRPSNPIKPTFFGQKLKPSCLMKPPSPYSLRLSRMLWRMMIIRTCWINHYWGSWKTWKKHFSMRKKRWFSPIRGACQICSSHKRTSRR